MFPLKLLGIAVAGGAALGVWASGAVREKLGGGSTKKLSKSKTNVVYLDDDVDTEEGIQIVAKRKPKAKPEETEAE